MEMKAFFSHRYKSPEVNLYFHELFSEVAEVQFDVAVGQMPTNVTRLEKMIRDADAFIGVYPFTGEPGTRAASADLQNASKYFRLELDLAIRSRKPSIVFFDQRYSQVLRFPRSFFSHAFDIQEVTGHGGSPQRTIFRRLFESYCEQVKISMTAAGSEPVGENRSETGILVPVTGRENSLYSKECIDAVEETLIQNGINRIKHLRWPPILNSDYLSDIESLDWLIADIGETAMNSGIAGYLHGRLVPTVRLLKYSGSLDVIKEQAGYRGLYGGVEVGYQKDIIYWSDIGYLKTELAGRLLTLTSPVRRISSRGEGESYFRAASLRKEPVFLSYCGKNEELAGRISDELKKRFQSVFDYKDGESISPGEPWLKEIFDKLSESALGIPLVSSDYLQSGNCEHEAQEMVSLSDAGKMMMIPIKLYKEDRFELPTWMRNIQYMHVYDYTDIRSLADKIVDLFIRTSKKTI